MAHGDFHRGLQHNSQIQRSEFAQRGVFGRMFPTLDVQEFDDALLERLAAKMRDNSGGEDNLTIPAGYTFLGQFIDHDMTFDPTSSLERQNDPEAIYNFRTPLLELDSVYGSGPGVSPHLYDQSEFGKLLIGQDSAGAPESDLPRNLQGTAIIGDPRNDENLIVSQLHLAFLKFHNRVLAKLKADVPSLADPQDRFREAQRIVRWHYQWLIVEEFLPRILSKDTYGQIFKKDSQNNIIEVNIEFLHFYNDPFIPIEFAVAAYRFGHSMVRPGYSVNQNFSVPLFGAPNAPSLNPRTIQNAANISGAGVSATLLNPLWSIDWSRFFELGPQHTKVGANVPQTQVVDTSTILPGGQITVSVPQLSKKIDSKLSGTLFSLPGSDPNDIRTSLAFRNLKRGAAFSLPWGQNVADAILKNPSQKLTKAQLDLTDSNGPIQFPADRVPLWYYILREAEVKGKGKHLGPVGGRIVGEVFAALLLHDPKSYLAQQPGWQPNENVPIRLTTANTFTVGDFLNFASS